MKPTYEQLESTLHHTKVELEQTKAELERTKAELAKAMELLKIAFEEIAKLKEQLNLNSKNSSKPPSTDRKGNTPPDGQKKGRKGRKGKARPSYPAERVNKHIPCIRENCPHCGSNAIELSAQAPEILQQAELPEVQAIVSEYQLLKYDCKACGKDSSGTLPEGIPDSAFGPKLMGLLAALTGVFHLAKREAIELIKDLYDVDMAVGSVSNIEERVAKALDPVYGRIHVFVIESKTCKHFDETGWRNSGKRHFVWVASCQHAAVYSVDQARSAEAFRRVLRGSPIGFAAVTDRYAVYNSLGENHQYCLAHLIRDFRRYAERDEPDKEIGQALEKELKTVCRIHRRYREAKISLADRNRRLGACKRKVEFWFEDGLANGSEELHKLCDTLLREFDRLWSFMKVPGMEPTNNLAERDLRKLVIWRKKSYGTKSDRGKKFVERITTVTQTLRRQAKNVLHYIQAVVDSFYRGSALPFISEAMGF